MTSDLVEQCELIEELVKVDLFIAPVIIEHVESVDDVTLGEAEMSVDRVHK